MYKKEFISFLAEKNNCTKREALKVIEMFKEGVIAALKENKTVQIKDFGKFYGAKVSDRKGFNIKKREAVLVPAYYLPRFRAGNKLKRAISEVKNKT